MSCMSSRNVPVFVRLALRRLWRRDKMKCPHCKNTMRFFVMDPGEDNY
jgi:hypothetical protein